MKGIMKSIGIAVLGFGTIMTIVVTSKAADIGDFFRWDNFAVGVFFYAAFTVAITAAVYFAFSEVLETLESMNGKIRSLESEIYALRNGNTGSGIKNSKKPDANVGFISSPPLDGYSNGWNNNVSLSKEPNPSLSILGGVGVDETEKLLFTNKTYSGAPFVIHNAQLIYSSSQVKLRIKLKNISNLYVNAIKISVITRDSFGELIDQDYSHTYINLNIAPGGWFDEYSDIILNNPQIRDADVNIEAVQYSNGQVWNRSFESKVDAEVRRLFFYDEHKDKLMRLSSAREIHEYLMGLRMRDDLLDRGIQQVAEIAELERMYGNMKNDAINRIKKLDYEG